jgi:hypothetical protein
MEMTRIVVSGGWVLSAPQSAVDHRSVQPNAPQRVIADYLQGKPGTAPCATVNLKKLVVVVNQVMPGGFKLEVQQLVDGTVTAS